MEELIASNKGIGNPEGLCFWAGFSGLVYKSFLRTNKMNSVLKAHRHEDLHRQIRSLIKNWRKEKKDSYLPSLKAKPFLIKYLETSTRSPFSSLQKIFTGNGHVMLFSWWFKSSVKSETQKWNLLYNILFTGIFSTFLQAINKETNKNLPAK